MAKFEFTRDEMNDMIYAAREARIRFKRARTLFREGHESYSQWDEETLNESIAHYTNLEMMLREKHEVAFGDVW